MYRFCMSDNSWEMHSMINNGTGGLKWCLSCLKWEKWLTSAKLDKLNRAVHLFPSLGTQKFFWLLLPPPHFFFSSVEFWGLLRRELQGCRDAVISTTCVAVWLHDSLVNPRAGAAHCPLQKSLPHMGPPLAITVIQLSWQKEGRSTRWCSAPSQKRKAKLSGMETAGVLEQSFFRKGKWQWVRVALPLLEMISLPFALLSLTSAVHRQGHSRVPGPPFALVIVRHLGITQPVSSDRHIAVTPGTAKLQTHHHLLQYQTDLLGGLWVMAGCWAQQHRLYPLEMRYMAQASSYQEANERLCRNSGLFVFIQRSKTVTLCGRIPAPDPGVLQEQSRGCEQFRQRFLCCWRYFERFHH